VWEVAEVVGRHADNVVVGELGVYQQVGEVQSRVEAHARGGGDDVLV